ncbi:MAG: hypothetical protein J4F37_08600 [Acidobacteria bacterium]|nr:hypothetical protein [Acidobacteriota bacterium]
MHMWTRHWLHLPLAMLVALGITGAAAEAEAEATAAEAEATEAEVEATEAEAAAVQDDAAPNSGMLGFSAGVDFVSDYYFRGIIQETGGFIAQPFLDASMSLGPVSITAGTWNSLHSVGDDGFVNEGAPQIYYESDFYAGLGIAAGDMVGIDLTYTAYMSPRGSWGTTKEVALGLSFDTFAAPYATFAFEAAGGADGGPNEGSYVEIGFEPGVPLEDAPVSLSFPVTFAASMSNYFEYQNDMGVWSDGAGGFFSIGASLGVPLPVPEEYGSWDLAVGVNALMFSESVKILNGEDKGAKVIGLFGISLGY